MRKNIFIFLIGLIVLIAGLNEIALNFYLYWRIWWFDVLMHFLGGLWVGLTALWIYFLSGYIKNIKKDKVFIFGISLFTVLVIGIGWEVFEYIIDAHIGMKQGYWEDTFIDLFMDILGASLASVFFLKNIRENRIKNYSVQSFQKI